jgi:branched-chain amino acid transport system substrate-binding protein
MRWDGDSWGTITGWMASAPEDAKLVRAKYEASALKYAKEKGITPRQCPES